MDFVPQPAAVRWHSLCMFRSPQLWQFWPFLPVKRSAPDGPQLGLLYDAVGACGRFGYSATVFLSNLFLLPPEEEAFFALPKCVYDTPEEILADGWSVD